MNSRLSDITVQPLTALTAGQDWRLRLVHDRAENLLIWITRGQGRMLLEGSRRGLGPHNALWIPAGQLFSLDLSGQSTGLAVALPVGTPLRLPEMPRHLRIRDANVQAELSALTDAALREGLRAGPLWQDAMEAHGALISVWLRRQIMQEEHVPEPRNAAARLSARFCALVAGRYTTGAPMAEYADELGVSATHLTRSVKSATGRTAAEIIAERVVYAARHLLVDTRQPAHLIARHLGFGSAAYFSRFMQHHTGHSPSQLRG